MDNYKNILQRAKGIGERIIELRREFHQHPELAFREFNTARKVEKILRDLGVETKMLVNGTGVRGFLQGRKAGKTIALRADIDALPIQEEAEVPYRSTNPGVMHACGHDAHTAMLLGAATLLAEQRKEFDGNVVFLFQPAEEIGEGARKMVEEGALDGVDSILGIHVSSSFDSGTFHYRCGPTMAAGDFFEVKITGKGGHGGMPHNAVDPIAIAANAINALQTIVSREIDPTESAVVSICKIEGGGGAYNIIPDSVTFGGTIRSLNPEVRAYLPKRMNEILDGVVRAMRGRYDFNLMEKFPVTINDHRMTTFVAKVATNLMGKESVFEMKPVMGSEDFSYYLQKIPGAFVYLGVKNMEKGLLYPHHHPRFDVDEEVLPTGTAIHVAVALDYLNEEAPL
jgi:amidohydrolase